MALSNVGRRWPLLLSAVGIAALGGAALAQAGGEAAGPDAAALYAQHCAMCHGANLQGQLAPALNDAAFKQKWDGKAQALADYIRTNMPPGNAGALTAADHAAIEREVVELKAEAEEEKNPRLREVKQKRVEILEKRLQRFVQAEESREIVSHQLASIEDLLRLTHEQSIAIRDVESVSNHLDVLSAEIAATDETVREMEKFLAISDELSAIPAAPDRTRVR